LRRRRSRKSLMDSDTENSDEDVEARNSKNWRVWGGASPLLNILDVTFHTLIVAREPAIIATVIAIGLLLAIFFIKHSEASSSSSTSSTSPLATSPTAAPTTAPGSGGSSAGASPPACTPC
jgi:hypothetical protein